MNPDQADLCKPVSPATILTLDDLDFAKGRVTLQTVPGVGTFLPDDPASPSLGIPTGTRLRLVIGSFRPLVISNWVWCSTENCAFGFGQHYHFEVVQPS